MSTSVRIKDETELCIMCIYCILPVESNGVSYDPLTCISSISTGVKSNGVSHLNDSIMVSLYIDKQKTNTLQVVF